MQLYTITFLIVFLIFGVTSPAAETPRLQELAAAWQHKSIPYEVALWRTYSLLAPKLIGKSIDTLALDLGSWDEQLEEKIEAAKRNPEESVEVVCQSITRWLPSNSTLVIEVDFAKDGTRGIEVTSIHPKLELFKLRSAVLYDGGVVARVLSLADFKRRKKINGRISEVEVTYSPIWIRDYPGNHFVFYVTVDLTKGTGKRRTTLAITYAALTALKPTDISGKKVSIRGNSVPLIASPPDAPMQFLDELGAKPTFWLRGGSGNGVFEIEK